MTRTKPTGARPAPRRAGSGLKFAPDLMEKRQEKALVAVAEELLSQDELLRQIWPAAYDFGPRAGKKLSSADIELVVMGLDRIGAPPGSSGAKIFIVYFAHRPASGVAAFVASPPLVMKLGDPGKLKKETDFKKHWPTLSEDVRARLALPLELVVPEPDIGVLAAPFRSQYHPQSEGQRHRLELIDLWTLLHADSEVLSGALDTPKIGRWLDDTIELITPVHRNNKAHFERRQTTYSGIYDWYLRDTIAAPESSRRNEPVMRRLLGDGASVDRYGKAWPNPTRVAAKLFESGSRFEAVLGPVHGDLHPKNIVRDGGAVTIIDFGWAHHEHHVLVDYILLDLNVRAVTLPSQVELPDILAIAHFLNPTDRTPPAGAVAKRADLIKQHLWERARGAGLIQDWRSEYLVPLFIVGYGLLVHLDSARNQEALLATVLAAGEAIETSWNAD